MRPLRLAAIAAFVLIAGLSGFAIAQTLHDRPEGMTMPKHSGAMGMDGHAGTMPMHGHGGEPAMMGQHSSMQAVPQGAGQAAFGAVQEILRMLEADPSTDWSKVDLDSLRAHLIDMDEVTLHAEAQVEKRDDGIRVTVTGEGRTELAIRRMIPEHARTIDGQSGWRVTTSAVAHGVILDVASADAKQAEKIRGLGFIGIMAEGEHHPLHHLAMARGEMHP